MSASGAAGRLRSACGRPGPSYAAPSTVTPGPLGDHADLRPALGQQRAARGTSRPGVVVAAGEDEPQRVGARARRRRPAGARRSRRPPERTSIATPLAVGDVPDVGQQPVGDVDHRGRAERGGLRRRRRRAARDAGRPRRALRGRAEPAGQHGQPAGGPALASGDRHHVAGAGPDRRTGSPATEPSAVTETITWSARVRSPPTTRGAHQGALLGDAVGELEGPGDRQVRRARRARRSARSPGRPSR